MDGYNYHFDGSSSQYQFYSEGSRAVYFANNSDPLVTIDCTAYWARTRARDGTGSRSTTSRSTSPPAPSPRRIGTTT